MALLKVSRISLFVARKFCLVFVGVCLEVAPLGRPQAGALLWGPEYGGGRGTDSLGRAYTDRFKAPRNKRGYWIAPAVDYYTPIVAKEYIDLIQGVIKKVGLD
jgi:hypothetical protein